MLLPVASHHRHHLMRCSEAAIALTTAARLRIIEQ
jgi:hypothetical protein